MLGRKDISFNIPTLCMQKKCQEQHSMCESGERNSICAAEQELDFGYDFSPLIGPDNYMTYQIK